MAYKRFGLGGQIIPFWRREMEPLPVWQKGDPQIRIFLPTFWMRMIKRPDNTPKDQVHFITHPQMTRFDIKNYLEKIYQVPVAHVRTEVKLTRNRAPGLMPEESFMMRNYHLMDPVRDKKKIRERYSEEYKKAVVILANGETFEYPDMESKITENDQLEAYEEFKEESDAKELESYKKGNIPSWFM